jgi:hypothetical protein
VGQPIFREQNMKLIKDDELLEIFKNYGISIILSIVIVTVVLLGFAILIKSAGLAVTVSLAGLLLFAFSMFINSMAKTPKRRY